MSDRRRKRDSSALQNLRNDVSMVDRSTIWISSLKCRVRRKQSSTEMRVQAFGSSIRWFTPVIYIYIPIRSHSHKIVVLASEFYVNDVVITTHNLGYKIENIKIIKIIKIIIKLIIREEESKLSKQRKILEIKGK